MYSVIVGVIVGLAAAYFGGAEEAGSSAVLIWIFAPVFGGIAGLLLCLVFQLFVPFKEEEEERSLVAVKTLDQVVGAFVFGTGTLKGQRKYHMMVRNDDGSLTPHWIYANTMVRITEDSSIEDSGRWTIVRKVKDKSHFLARFCISLEDSTHTKTHKLTVPEGTVVTDFRIE